MTMLTVVFSNGQKLTTNSAMMVYAVNEDNALSIKLGDKRYLVNWQNVAYVRRATKEEIEYAKYHGEGEQ